MGLLETTYLKEEKNSNIHTECEPSTWRGTIQFAQVVIGSEWAESENSWLGRDLSLGFQPSSSQAIRTFGGVMKKKQQTTGTVSKSA